MGGKGTNISTFEYEVYFHKEFNFVKSGKLPGKKISHGNAKFQIHDFLKRFTRWRFWLLWFINLKIRTYRKYIKIIELF